MWGEFVVVVEGSWWGHVVLGEFIRIHQSEFRSAGEVIHAILSVTEWNSQFPAENRDPRIDRLTDRKRRNEL
jgi:hypothetical protein